MIDARLARQNPDVVKQNVVLRKVDPAKADVDRWLQLDERRREIQTLINDLNADRKRVAELGKANPDAARAAGTELREKSRALETELDEVTAAWNAIMEWFPNFIDPQMPHGRGEEDNIEECAWVPGAGYLPSGKLGRANDSAQHMPQSPVHAEGDAFEPVHYAELGELLGGIDNIQGGKVSGSRFAYILGDIALMQYAIQRVLTDELVRRGYAPIIPPLMVRERSLF